MYKQNKVVDDEDTMHKNIAINIAEHILVSSKTKFVNDCFGVVACTTASFTPAATGVQGRIYSEISHGVFAKHEELHSNLVSNLRLIGD